MKIGTKSMAGVAAGASYTTSFGSLPSGTEYKSGYAGLKSDLRPQLNEKLQLGLKAFNTQTGGAGTAGYAMIPVFVDPEIVDRTRAWTPLVEIFPRVTNQGITADYNFISSKGGAFCAIEDAALAETDTTPDRASVTIKYLYSVGRVTGQAQAAVPSYMLAGFQPSGAVAPFSDQLAGNAKRFEVLVKARELKELEENLIINGNSSTSGIAGNPNGTEFDGIIAIQSTTNKLDKNTTALELDDINTASQYAFDDGGLPSLAVCSSAVFTDLMHLLTSKIGYLQPSQDVEFGFQYITLHTPTGPVKVIQSKYMSNVTGSKAIYLLDMSVWEMRVLQDMTYEDLAKTNDSEKFSLKIYEALICRAPAFNAWVGEIA